MDFSNLLRYQVFDELSVRQKLFPSFSVPFLLLVSRGVARHDELFAAVASHLISDKSPSFQVTTSTPEERSTLLLALYHSARRYHGYLDLCLRQASPPCSLSVFDLGVEVKQHLLNADPDADISGTVKSSLDKIIDKFKLSSPKNPEQTFRRIVFVDDLTVLLHLGFSYRQLMQTLDKLLSNAVCDLLVLGFHDNEHRNDPLMFRFLQHLSRRSFCRIDVSPLETGYTASLDGQMTIQQMPINSQEFQKAGEKFHFKLEGRSIRCFPPGSSNIVR